MKSTSKPSSSRRVPNILPGRAGWRLEEGWGHVSVLEGGGHICELNLCSVPGVNPLWQPPWRTIDPQRYSPRAHQRLYGPPPESKLLAGISGHSLGFDHFGPPSEEEIAAGLSTHGEAPVEQWKTLRFPRRNSLQYGCTLHEAQIDFARTIELDHANPIVYCEERATNLRHYDRPISWNQHVTFGPPFLEPEVTLFDMSATRAVVCPSSFSTKMFLRPDAEFTWPHAPRKNGGFQDLRTMPNQTFGHYTAQLFDPALPIAFISACNPRQRLLVVYAFRRADFPWVGNWEERNNRSAAPWNKRTFCRGIEFSTTPFPVPRRETIDRGPLFGEATYRWLPARSSLTMRYLILLFRAPENFAGVEQFTIERRRARLIEAGPQRREIAVPVPNFL